MRYYPVNLNISHRACLVIGGGSVAERKAKGLLACGALVTVISPEISAGLLALLAEKQISWLSRPYQAGDLAGAFLVIAATDDDRAQQAVQEEAESRNILLNVADVPERCNFILPSILSRGDLTIAVSTSGNSPALAKQVRERLEELFGPEYELYLELLGSLRTAVLEQGLPPAANKVLFQKLLHPEMPTWLRTREWPRIEQHLRRVLPQNVGLDWLNETKDKLPSSVQNGCQ
jgi:precorrin-2 dehydrogenase / sirohydrochlorin ferrochelatase